jgi:hypothetical protein
MGTFKQAELPTELAAAILPKATAEGNAVYLSIRVFDVKNPEDLEDFHICLDTKFAIQLAADLLKAAEKVG